MRPPNAGQCETLSSRSDQAVDAALEWTLAELKSENQGVPRISSGELQRKDEPPHKEAVRRLLGRGSKGK